MCERTRRRPLPSVRQLHHVLGGESQAVGAGRRRGRRGGRGVPLGGGGVGGGAPAAAAARAATWQSQFELVRDLRRNVLEADACAYKITITFKN